MQPLLVHTGCNLCAFKTDQSPKNVMFIFTNVAVMEIVTIIDANVTLDGVKILIAVVQVQVSTIIIIKMLEMYTVRREKLNVLTNKLCSNHVQVFSAHPVSNI